jgi:GAF domain-containing protein
MSSKEEIFQEVQEQADLILEQNSDRDTILKKICELLDSKLETYDWTGFYIADPNAERELVLGPYVGEATDHTRIKFGQGICGQAADTLETFVVDDVSKADNYLACSIHVKSEIVVPVLKNGEFMAELDIDSHQVAAMDEVDQQELEKLCAKIAHLF